MAKSMLEMWKVASLGTLHLVPEVDRDSVRAGVEGCDVMPPVNRYVQ